MTTRLMRMFFVLVGVFALACLVSCLSACGGGEERGIVRPLTEQEQSLVTSSNRFGFGFFGEAVAQSDGGNVFVSPLSVSMALGMTYNGARGATEEGMREALAFGELTTAEINEGYRGLIDLLCHLDPKVTMEIANSIWYRQEFQVLQEFLDVNRAYFDAVVRALDFSDPGAADVINAWVDEKTHGKIETIVQPPINPLTVMFLINAVYFKAEWALQFDKKETVGAAFHAPGGDKTVKMMHLHEEGLRYLETEQFQAVDLLYGDGLFGMTVLLPRGEATVDDLVAELSEESWDAWMAGMTAQEGNVYLPRFELRWKSSLVDVLAALGMQVAFTGQADFTGINPAGGLYISDVKHKTYVRVDEEGTEAAAVTSVEVGATSVQPDYFTMNVDRPFLFIIHDSHSQALLFMGKIVDPPSE